MSILLYAILTIAGLCFFPSCATVCKTDVYQSPSGSEKFNGTYQLVGKSLNCLNCTPVLLEELEAVSRSYNKQSDKDTIKTQDTLNALILHVYSERRMLVVEIRPGKPDKKVLFAGKFNKDGYFSIRRKLFIRGLFPLMWAMGTEKAILGLDKDGNLLLSQGSSGLGFFVAIPVLGTSFCENIKFERIQ